MKFAPTVAGRFLVDDRVVPLLSAIERDLKVALAIDDQDRYRVQRGILESLLAIYASPLPAADEWRAHHQPSNGVAS